MGNSRREVALVVVVMVAMMVAAEAAISCGTVSSKLSPCIPYAQGKEPVPSARCCSGVQSLYAATKSSRPDRVTACNCIKSLASALKAGNVAGIPGKCGVKLGYSIGPGTNCATIP